MQRWVLILGILLRNVPTAAALDPSLEISSYAHTAWTLHHAAFRGYPRSLAQTRDGYLWLATEFGLVRFDGVRFVPWEPPADSPPLGADIVKLFAARDGSLWIGTTRGLSRWKDGQLTPVAALSTHYITAIREDETGTVWVGTSAGLTGVAQICAIRNNRVTSEGGDGSLGRVGI
jgi:ligand-binding sensor domain-containing protein